MLRTQSVLLVVVAVILVGAVTAQAASQDIYVWTGSSTPDDPYYSPGAGGPIWPFGWFPLPRTGTGDPEVQSYSVGSHQAIWFALENEENLEAVKTVNFNYVGDSFAIVGMRAGFSDGHAIDTWPLHLDPGAGSSLNFVGTIDPQPDWEWIKLTNTSDSSELIVVTRYDSTCNIPEPAGLALYVMGLALVVMRRQSTT